MAHAAVLHTLLCIGAAFPIGFVIGWAAAEAATGRFAERARFDREQRRPRAATVRCRAAADDRARGQR